MARARKARPRVPRPRDAITKAKRPVTAADEARTDELDSRIREIDTERERVEERLEVVERYDMGFGSSTQTGLGGEQDNRSLGEWAADELRSVLASGSGSAVIPVPMLGRVWDKLHAESVGLASGFAVVPTERSELRIPRLTADPTAAFVAEGAVIAATDPGIDEILATPRKLAALTQTSNEALSDGSPYVLDLIFKGLVRSLSLALDKAFYEGNPATNPNSIRGLRHTVGVQTVAMGNTAFSNLDPILEAFGLLEAENATPTAIVAHPTAWTQLMGLREQTGSLKPLLSESAGSPTDGVKRSVLGVPVYLSSQIDDDVMYVYEAAEVVAVRREELRVEIDRSRLFDRDMAEERAVSRWDLAVPNVKAVALISGIDVA